MDMPVDDKVSLDAVMKRGALVCVVALGGVAVGLAVWALRRWHDEREWQAWRASVHRTSQQESQTVHLDRQRR